MSANLKKIRSIYEEVYREGNVVPFAPYLEGFNFLCDEQEEDRKLGINNNKTYFQKKVFDVMWIYGTRISKGMQQEINWCKTYGIDVFYMDNLDL